MSPAERFVAAAQGREVDRKPVLAWPVGSQDADIDVRPAQGFEDDGKPALAHLTNLYGLVRPDCAASPSEVGDLLDQAVQKCVQLARGALQVGAIGVLYEIRGATPSECTPMEYGGLYLERDRELLEALKDSGANVLYVGGREPYLDFVSDLPAHVFAWDVALSEISVGEVRAMRPGALAADDPDADILLTGGRTSASSEDCLTLHHA